MAYYKVIKGVKYDGGLFDAAEGMINLSPNSLLTIKNAQFLFDQSKDSGKITPIEIATLNYLAANFPFQEDAKKWLAQKIKDAS